MVYACFLELIPDSGTSQYYCKCESQDPALFARIQLMIDVEEAQVSATTKCGAFSARGRKMKLRLVGKTFLLCFVLAVTSAQAGLIVNTVNTDITAFGFGTVPTILTLQRDVLEMGCIVPTDNIGGFSASCAGLTGYSDVPGGVTNNPQAPKYATPTLTQLGVSNYGNMGILFNVNENGDVAVTLQKLTLTLYRPDLSVLRSFSLADSDGSGPTDFLNITQGQGGAGFVITIASSELENLGAFDGNVRVGLAAEIGCLPGAACDVAGQYGTSDGAESFTVANVAAPQEIPEPATAALLGGGLLLFAWALRRRKAS